MICTVKINKTTNTKPRLAQMLPKIFIEGVRTLKALKLVRKMKKAKKAVKKTGSLGSPSRTKKSRAVAERNAREHKSAIKNPLVKMESHMEGLIIDSSRG